MIYANEKECIALGLDPDEVEKVARRIANAAKDAQKLGLQVFAGSSGSLREIGCDPRRGAIVAAHISVGSWDGGDGATGPNEDGLIVGEY